MSNLQLITGTSVYHEPIPPAGVPAFLLFVASGDPSTLPPQIAPADAWQGERLPGWFVVLPEAPQDLGQLAVVLQSSGAFPQPEHTSVAWTTYDGKAIQPPQRLTLRGEALDAVTTGPAAIAIGRYGVVLPDGNPVVAQLDGTDIASLRITYVPRPGWPAPNDIGCFLPFTGPSRFCLQALGLIGDAGDDVTSGADISIRYFVPTGTSGAMASIRFPLFEPDFIANVKSKGLTLSEATIDPLTNWWAPGVTWQQRTSYQISGQMYELTQSGESWTIALLADSRLRTTFRTVTGSPLYLRPIAASFVPQPLPSQPGAFYLTPSGTFALETESAAGGGELLCGLAATERIVFTSGDVMTFVPNSNAHAVQFPVTATAVPPLLDDKAVTAWVSITTAGAVAPSFHAQPKTAATFGTPPGTTSPPNIAPFYSPVVRTFGAEAAAFPIAPYAAVEDPAFDYDSFEEQILAPSRMTGIAASPEVSTRAALVDASAVSATTPQGFLVTVASTEWSDLQFASQARSDRTDRTVQTLSVATVSSDLQAALQSRSIFLVVTNPTPFSTFAGLISIADWPFDLTKLGETDEFGPRNVLIFKFCSGTLLDLAGNVPRWTNATTFNSDPTTVSPWLTTYFKTAISLAEDNARYANIAKLIVDPNWNGILGLRVDVPMASLPDDLRGLAAGINAVQFAAHHVGIDVTTVQQRPDGSFTMPATSSLFGLINYIDQDTAGSVLRRTGMQAAAGPGDPGYSFRVLTLFAEFANSQIVGFDSQIVLTMTTFFGEAAQRQTDSSTPPIMRALQNSVELFGSLEHRVAPDGSSVVVYVFQTDGSTRYVLPTSQIFNYIEITRMEFNTLQPQSKGSTHVASQFRMWGLLNFEITGGIDLFSFGDSTPPPSTDATPAGLAYSNLIVSMDFDDANNVVQNLAFLFDPTGVAFDLGSTTALRQPSLFSGLPLSLDTIVTGAGGTPSSAGYLPVLAADLKNVAPLDTSSWFGLTFILSLGTPGALADICSFNATLVAAWSPGAGGVPGRPEPQAAILIQLPGTAPGKKELSLQQVLRLSIDRILIDPQPPVEGFVSLKLTFTNVGLKFLGFKLPPGAVIDLALAGGGMSGGTESGSVGWYGVYARQT